MIYKLLANGDAVLRVEDGATIPNDPANRDWVAYQAFLANGGVPLPADAPGIPDNAAAMDSIQRSAALDELQRLMSQGASQEEINQGFLDLLTKEQ